MVRTLLMFTVFAVFSNVHAQDEANRFSKVREQSELGAVKSARVYFVGLKDGATVKRKFKVRFAVEGLKVAPAGAIEPGSGHFHVLINVPVVKEGEVVATDEKHLHFGKGQTEAELNLPPGEHTLVLQFADGAHRAYHSMLAQTIKVIVK